MPTAPVTAVIPCFRCTDTIERAVSSVAAQTVLPSAVILVDDCSGDGTLESLHALRRQYGAGWVTVLPLPRNGGPGTARNKGWQVCSTTYVAFLDADDSWSPQKIELQHAWMSSNPDVVLSAHGRVEPGERRSEFSGTENITWRDVRPRSLLWRNWIRTSSVMARSDVSPRFPADRRYSEDYWLWLQLAYIGGRITVSDAPLATAHGRGLSGNLWAMERGELGNFRELRRQGHITGLELAPAVGWSLTRFARRGVLELLRRERTSLSPSHFDG